jgi:protein transport protein HofC
VRRKLIQADKAARQGGDWIGILEHRGLIRPADAEVLSSASEVGNLSWAMRELAETGERRLAYRFQAVVQSLFPLVVIAIGVVVALIAFSFFAPLISLLGRLSG